MQAFLGSVGFGVVTASILAIAGVGFTLQYGVTNILNLAYGSTMTLCAYVGYLVNSAGESIWISILAAAVFGALFSALLNRAVYARFQRKGTPLWGIVLVTIAVALIVQNAFLLIAGPNFYSYTVPATSTLHLAGVVLTGIQLQVIAVAIAAMLVVRIGLKRTKLGKSMRAISSDSELAQSCGINVSRVTDIAWLISGALCGVAAVTFVMNTVSFQATTGDDFLVVIVAAAVLGGVGNAYGAMIGALIVGVVTEVAAAYFTPALKNVFAFGILVIVLLFRSQGLFPSGRAARGAVT